MTIPRPLKDDTAALAAAVRIIKAQDKLLIAYRTGSSRAPGAAIDTLNTYRPRLDAYLEGKP